jgi:hypothetical protein
MVWGERAEYGDGEGHHLWGGVNVQDTTYNLGTDDYWRALRVPRTLKVLR